MHPDYIRYFGIVLALGLAGCAGASTAKLDNKKTITVQRWTFTEIETKTLPSASLLDLVRATTADFPYRSREFSSVRVIRKSENRTYSFSLRVDSAAGYGTLSEFRLMDSDLVHFVSPDYL